MNKRDIIEDVVVSDRPSSITDPGTISIGDEQSLTAFLNSF